MNLTQNDLDTSKAWKAYRTLAEKAEAAETVAELKKLDAGSDVKYDRVREFFSGNKQLGSDLVDLCRKRISGRIQMYAPKRARLPRPDYESIVKGSFAGLKRNIRIVEEFRKARLADDFIESIRLELPRSVSALRNTLPQLERARTSRPPKKPIPSEESIEALKAMLQPLSDKVDKWEVESRMGAGQSATDFLLQSGLDTSSLWKGYCELHRLIQMAKSLDSLADIPDRAALMKNDLAIFFRDSGIAESLVTWIKMSCGAKSFELSTPKRVRGTTKDWERVLSEFAMIQTEFQIAGFFRDRSLGHSLIWTMTTRLSPRSQNLAGNAKSFRSNAGYKDAAPGTWKKLTAKQEKAIQEIETFAKSMQRTLAKWKKSRK